MAEQQLTFLQSLAQKYGVSMEGKTDHQIFEECFLRAKMLGWKPKEERYEGTINGTVRKTGEQ